MSDRRYGTLLLSSAAAVFFWSMVGPADRFTWWLEVFPVLAGLALLLATGRRFPLSRLVYTGIWAHALILMVGSHYTYAEVPLFNLLRDGFDFGRNHYDRVGHFAQGFFPALVAREILLRTSPLKPGKWLFFLVVCICLAFSAFYELIEWWVAIGSGSAADQFLGTQGDVWDTQWDMFLALAGAAVSQLVLGRSHDRSLARLEGGPGAG
jgi:putative membrane protein